MNIQPSKRTADFSPEEFFAAFGASANGSQTVQIGDAKFVDSAKESSFIILPNSALEVNGKKYDVLENIGRGCNGGVALCAQQSSLSECKNSHEVVIKYAFDGCEESLRREISYMNKLSNHGVVRLIDSGSVLANVVRGESVEEKRLEVLVAERLFENPFSYYGRPLPPSLAIDIYLNSLLTLEDIHRAKFIHGDIKPENLLLRSNRQVGKASRRVARLDGDSEDVQSYRDRSYAFMVMHGEYLPVLGDLGCAVDTSAKVLTEYAATPAYLCPEAMLEYKMGPKRDVWALTVSFVEMLTGVEPYVEMDGLMGIGKAMMAKTPPFDVSRIIERTFAQHLEGCQDKELYHSLEKASRDIHRIVDRGLEMEPAKRASTFELIEMCVNLFRVESTSYTDSEGAVQRRWTQKAIPRLQEDDPFFRRKN